MTYPFSPPTAADDSAPNGGVDLKKPWNIMNIVVVESPAKAKTINKYLGRGYEVLASFGHVRDLPPKDGSVDPDHDFKMIWEVDGKAQKRLGDIAKAVKGADKLILATDPDREGEAISWHVLEFLKQKKALDKQLIERVVFNRELEIERFVSKEYWSLVAVLATPRQETFEARLVGADGKKLQRLDIGSGAEAQAFKDALETAAFSVVSVDSKPVKRHPPPPFTTSTLQQEASRKLGFAPAHTMRIAQRLYEGVDIEGDTVGLITYMRTDGVDIAPEAIDAARRVIRGDYGERYLPRSAREYQTKAKNAQEAHEAIR